MNRHTWKEKLLYFALGVTAVLSMLFLTGANSQTPQIGRYQIQSWVRDQFTGVYIVDTATGVVKYVDRSAENKPFEEIK